MDQKYTDQQMALILKRASELQAAGDEPAHTLESIQQIARQVGIDPKLVADAAANLETSSGRVSLFGAPSAYRSSRQLPNTSATIDQAAVLATIRDHLPGVGEVRQVADGFEWHSGPADNKTVVAVSPNETGSTLRIDARQHGIRGLLYVGSVVTGLIATVGSIGVWSTPGVAVGLAAFGASLVGARAIWNRHVRERTKRFQKLSDALANQLGGEDSTSE